MTSVDYVYFENIYLQDRAYLESDGDGYSSITIDGFPEDDNKEGAVIAEVIITLKGEVLVVWHHNGYRSNTTVLELIAESKNTLRQLYDEAHNNIKEKGNA